MKYVIYDPASQTWFLAPDKGTTDDQGEAHRFTREEAERTLAHPWHYGCEMVPVGESECQREGTSE